MYYLKYIMFCVCSYIATRRKISIVKEMPHIKSPSPPMSKPTNILLIKNLVRPFTLNQIKELLSRTGTIVENGFWMDRIKSKCIVEACKMNYIKYKILQLLLNCRAEYF